MERIQLSPLTSLGVGPTINAAFYGPYIIAIQTGTYPTLSPDHHGRLLVIDPKSRKVIGQMDGIGSARQLVIQGDIAYITSREDGLFIVDLKNPAEPELLSHYETTEFATGIALANDLLVISLRQYGLELIDVRDPKNPRFLSLVRTGEAQSLWLDGHHAYAGVWGSKELVIADISDPSHPKIASKTPLDGRGDGVTVRNHICFAATGQHARPPVGVADPAPETYEKLGNGLEIFDVHDPAHPVFLSRVKFPPYYGLTFDMWSVQLSGDLALVSNTRNGFFLVDISDLHHPRVLSRTLLPLQPDGTHDPIGGFAIQGNQLALAGTGTDLFLAEFSQALPPVHRAELTVSPASPAQPLEMNFLTDSRLPWKRVLEGYQVQYILDGGNRLFAACSDQGLLVLEKNTFRILQQLPVTGPGLTRSVAYQAPYLYVAEGPVGMVTYKEAAGKFEKIHVYSPHGRSATDLQLSDNGKFLLLQCASVGVVALSLKDPAAPRPVDEKLDYVGLFYGRHFPQRGRSNDFYLAVNRDGLRHIHVTEEGMTEEPLSYAPHFNVGPSSGLDYIGDMLLCNGQLCFCVPLDHAPQKPIEKIQISGADYSQGKPRIANDLMVITERAEGYITICRIHDPAHIECRIQIRTTSSPDLACIDDQFIYLPAGRHGMLVLDRPQW